MNVQSRCEMIGTLYIFGIPVLDGLFATNMSERQKWTARIKGPLRWFCRIKWTLTWTTAQEYRDATGGLCKREV